MFEAFVALKREHLTRHAAILVLLDRLYQPLLALYPLYRQQKDGAARQFALQAELHRLFSLWPHD